MKTRELRSGSRQAFLVVFSLALLSSPAAARAGEDGDNRENAWKWKVVPYGWAASVGTDLKLSLPPAGGDGNSKFPGVLDKLDGAFQMHVEGRGQHLGAFVDFTYVGLAQERDARLFRTESDLDARLVEAAATWSPGGDRAQGMDLLVGLRYIDVDLTFELDPDAPPFSSSVFDASKSYSDLLAGLRYRWRLSERWGMAGRADVSFGSTEGTWGASLMANYETQNGEWVFGYKYLEVSLAAGRTSTDLRLAGPAIGYGFKF